jgi:hypothetical protein
LFAFFVTSAMIATVSYGEISAAAATENPSDVFQNRWSEPSPVPGGGDPFAGGSVVGLIEGTDPRLYSTCLDQLARDAADSGTRSWELTPCNSQHYVAQCGPDECSGVIRDDSDSVTYTVYRITNVANQAAIACSEGDAGPACFEAVGCSLTTLGDGTPWVMCPFELTPVDSLVVDMVKWRGLVAESSPVPSSVNPPGNSALLRAGEGAPGSWSDRTVLSDVRVFGDPVSEAIRAAATAGACVVLVILVMLPTQLINSTLEENTDRIHRWFRRLGKGRETRRQTAQVGKVSESVSRSKRHKIPEWVWGFPVLVVAAIITGFADPNFGFTLASLRFVLTAFLTFVVLNYVGTFLVWFVLRKRESAALPVVRVHYLYLVIIAITVLLTRFLNFQPALVFGVVLVIEATRVAKDLADKRAEEKSIGRMEFAIIFVTAGLGLVSWLLFNGVTLLAPTSGGPAPPLMLGVLVTAQEALGAITIEALTTLPILLLPLRFMPGALVFRWSKVGWAITFGVTLTLFSYVLVPMPNSWSTVSMSFTTWITALVAYAIFALVLWACFRFTRGGKASSLDGDPHP